MKISKYKTNKKIDYIIPQRIILEENCKNTDLLLNDTPVQALVNNPNVCTISKNGQVIIDIGEEIHGGIIITTGELKEAGTKLRVVFGESVSEAMSAIGKKGATNDHSPRDIILNIESYSTFRVGSTGYRFIKLEYVNHDINLNGIKGVFEYMDIPRKGAFESNDERLNKIWDTAVKTTHLCMQDYLWDGIKRDRLVWIGDMHVEVSTILSVFGENEIVPKSLDFVRDATPIDSWMNNIPSYSFWWLIIIYEWYLYTGNREYLYENEYYITGLVKNILSRIDENGKVDFEFYFVDWETFQQPEMLCGFHSVLVMALNASLMLCKYLKNESLYNECNKKLTLLKSEKSSHFNNKQVAALMSLSGLENAKKINSEVLSVNPTENISCFTGYYTLLAKAKAGDILGAINVIKEYWGAMLDLGATTFWESFDFENSKNAVAIDKIVPDGAIDAHGDFGKHCYTGFRCSLCHGWSSGPAPFIGRHIIGVKPLEPGFKKVCITPSADTFEYMKGEFPTPYGNITVHTEKSGDKVHTEIDAPKEIEIIEKSDI